MEKGAPRRTEPLSRHPAKRGRLAAALLQPSEVAARDDLVERVAVEADVAQQVGVELPKAFAPQAAGAPHQQVSRKMFIFVALEVAGDARCLRWRRYRATAVNPQ